jgi:1,4-alpha-glucan branching enzyme
VQFVFVDAGAATVAVVGDFNDWDPGASPLSRAQPGGLWVVTIPLLPGRHRYAFVVDGRRWIPDPGAPRAVGDDFDTPSSVVTVGGDS